LKNYLDLLKEIKDTAVEMNDRTGTGTISVIGKSIEHDLRNGFPLLTTKKIHFKSVAHELLWFLSGSDNISYLKENNVRIWNEWATEDGSLGPVYGVQWRRWRDENGNELDQIANVIDLIKNKPNSRRILFHGWNVAYLPDESVSPQENVTKGKMALPPCHLLYQFFVRNGELHAVMYQRSADMFLGIPFNIASLSLLTSMLANFCDLTPATVKIFIGDAHIYKNHFEQVDLQLSRETKVLPKLLIKRKPESFFDYIIDDFEIIGYDPHPAIKGEISV
jgi:thymidylate synthase